LIPKKNNYFDRKKPAVIFGGKKTREPKTFHLYLAPKKS